MSDQINADLRFSIIPEWVIDSQISDRAIRLYVILARYADNETLQAFPSRETLARRALCNAKAVTKAIDELVSIGAVIKQHRKQGDSFQSNLYTLRRVGPHMTSPRVTFDQGVGSDLTPPRVSDDSLTITTELEPENYIFKTAKSLPHNFTPSATIQETFQDKYPELNYQETLEAFIDHHTAKGSRFKDWDAAFRTWCRNAKRWSAPKTVIHKQELKPAAEGPGRRDWVKQMHDLGEHFECKPGEFGCK